MQYRIELSPAAQRQARRLTAEAARHIRAELRKLVDDPRPAGSIKLTGFASVWRIRVGDFRVIYEVNDRKRLLMVLRIARRNESTYQRL